MKKFKFKLQALLNLKIIKEKEIQNELSELINIQNIERLKQDEYKNRIQTENDKFAEKLRSGSFSYNDAMMFERFVDFAQRVIINAQDKIDGMEPEIQKVREKLIEASRERKVIEKIKEKRWKDFLYELNREISKENDDINQKMYVRKLISK